MASNIRSDIQGLRGISVLLVVLYHTDSVFSGGFIGVDVFFVISGYVIMQSLLNEFRNQSSISIKNFISRRINRLLPASTFVVIFTLIASVFIFSPYSEQGQIAKTSVSSTFFSTNLFFVLQNSYSALINNPFRHMWSLGVEEQFYLFLIFSITVISYFSREKKSVPNSILKFAIFTGAISFLANLIFSAGIRILPLPTRIAFFSPLTRIWELQVGVIAAFIASTYFKHQKKTWLIEVSSICGIFFIFFGALRFNSFIAFPGLYAIVPTIGAFMLVLFAEKSKLISPILTIRPLKYLGDISYSWYLWHWPVIVFSQILAPGNHTILLLSGFLSLIPSVISYHFVENRFRLQNKKIRPSPSRVLMISILSQIAVAFLVFIGASTTYGLKLQNLTGATGSWAYKAGCQMTEPTFPSENCFQEFNGASKTVLLIGDSQAGSLSDGVLAASRTLGLNFAVWYNDGCPVFPRPTLEREDCEPFLKELPNLIQKINPTVIIIANKSTLYTTGGAQRGGLTIKDQNGNIPRTYAESIRLWTQGLQSQFSMDPFRKTQILLVQQVPPSKPISPTLLKRHLENQKFNINSVPDRNELIKEELSSLSRFTNISFLDPAKSICPQGSCFLAVNGQALYSDEFHLSPYGSLFLKTQILESLQKLIPPL